MNLDKKIETLKLIAGELNREGITWALGASMLLYFKKLVYDFHDIDILVVEKDVDKVKKVMIKLKAKLLPKDTNVKYKTRTFLEYILFGVDIDIMAGFVIVNNNVAFDCSLKPDQIKEYAELDDEKIPLQSLDLWLKYYKLMGREEKVNIILNGKIDS